MAEEWYPVEEYEGLYDVSSLGRVMSLRSRRLLVAKPDRGGYLRVKLHRDAKIRRVPVHVLVARAFLGPRPVGLTVDHRDGDKAHNAVGNLRYLSRRENVLGSRNPAALNARRSTCKRGHPFDAENTYRWKGARQCRLCMQMHAKATYRRRLAKPGAK